MLVSTMDIVTIMRIIDTTATVPPSLACLNVISIILFLTVVIIMMH